MAAARLRADLPAPGGVMANLALCGGFHLGESGWQVMTAPLARF